MSCSYKTILLAGVLFGSSLIARAQNYDISWYTIGGGGTSSGGTYTVTGTIGQSDAGHMSGGGYSLDGGFWGIIAAVQTPGAPTLSITRTGNEVVLSWPSASTGFSLQQKASAGTVGGWNSLGATITTSGGVNYVTNTVTGGNQFFRLYNAQ